MQLARTAEKLNVDTYDVPLEVLLQSLEVRLVGEVLSLIWWHGLPLLMLMSQVEFSPSCSMSKTVCFP